MYDAQHRHLFQSNNNDWQPCYHKEQVKSLPSPFPKAQGHIYLPTSNIDCFVPDILCKLLCKYVAFEYSQLGGKYVSNFV
jgi:hypothetical protein